MIKLSFIKDSLLYTIGNALPMAASIILLPFYANYLSSTNYVALSFYIGISLLFQIIFSFSFEQYYGVIYTEIKHDDNKVKLLNGSIFLYLIIYGSILILFSLLIGQSLLQIIFDENIPVKFYPYGLLSVLTGFFNALFKVSMSTYIYTKKSSLFFYSNLLNFFATLIISLSGLFLFPDTLTGPVYGRFLSGIIIFIFNVWILKKDIIWKYERSFIQEIIQKSWSLFAYNILLWFIGNIDRYFLKNYVPVNDLAGYDLIMKCFIGIEFIQNGLSMAIISRVFDVWKKDNQVNFNTNANRYFNVFIVSNVFVITLFVFILPFFLKLIIKDENYYSSFQFIGLLSIPYIIKTLTYPYNFVFLYAKKTNHFFTINAITLVIQIVLSYLFIQNFGLIAAIVIHIITRIITIILNHMHVAKFLSTIKINYFKWFILPAIPAMLYAFNFITPSPQHHWINLLIIIIFLIITSLIYKQEIKQLLPVLKNKLFAQS